MFGLIKPCAAMGAEARETYRAHMCGACLGIREELGQVARAALNRDTIVLSVLAEHLQQLGDVATVGARTQAGSCPLRGMRTAGVIDPRGPAARYAAAVSVILLDASVRDHAEDGDRGTTVARTIRPATRRYGVEGHAVCRDLGVDLTLIEECIRDERRVRRTAGLGLDAYVCHTERAFAAGFVGAGTVVHTDGYTAQLDAVGRAFGRTAALVDALEDYEQDRRRCQFNLVAASWPEVPVQEQGRRAGEQLTAARDRIEHGLDVLGVGPGHLLRSLLVGALAHRTVAAVRALSPHAARAMRTHQGPGEARQGTRVVRRAGPTIAGRKRHVRVPLAGLLGGAAMFFIDDLCEGCCEGCGEACSEMCSASCEGACD